MTEPVLRHVVATVAVMAGIILGGCVAIVADDASRPECVPLEVTPLRSPEHPAQGDT